MNSQFFSETFDLRFGMEIPGWSNARADQVRKIIERNLPYDIALNSIIKTAPVENNVAPSPPIQVSPVEIEPKQKSLSINDATELAASQTDSVSASIGEYDFTKWPIETIALLVSYPKELPLSVRAINCLYSSGAKYFGEIVLEKREELYRIQNLGHKTAREISELISEFGLSFQMHIPGWSREKADSVREFIVSRLPPNAAITNLISKGSGTKIELLSRPKKRSHQEKSNL